MIGGETADPKCLLLIAGGSIGTRIDDVELVDLCGEGTSSCPTPPALPNANEEGVSLRTEEGNPLFWGLKNVGFLVLFFCWRRELFSPFFLSPPKNVRKVGETRRQPFSTFFLGEKGAKEIKGLSFFHLRLGKD